MYNFIASIVIYVLLFVIAIIKDGKVGKFFVGCILVWSSFSTALVFQGEYTDTLFWKVLLLIFHIAVGLFACLLISIFNDNIVEKNKKNGTPQKALKKKNKILTAVIAIIGGILGLHKFYLRKPAIGALYAYFWWTTIPAWLGFVEGIYYIAMSFEKFDRKYNNGVVQGKKQRNENAKDMYNTKQNYASEQNPNVNHNASNPQPYNMTNQNSENRSEEVNANIVNIENKPIAIGSIKAKGTLEDFIITVFDSTGKKYEFHSKDGEICSYRTGNMRTDKKYSEASV